MIRSITQVIGNKIYLTRTIHSDSPTVYCITCLYNLISHIMSSSPPKIGKAASRAQTRRILTIQQAITQSGSAADYQTNMMTIFNLQFLFSALIEMGFPIIFQAALLVCSDGTDCEEPLGCDREGGWVVSSTVKSVAYTFDLVCERKRMLGVGFDAFLYGGFFGSFYYGEIIERRGRRYAVLESMMIMIIGIIVSLVSGNMTLWSIGMFFVNFGFRGYYNAAVLSLTQVTSQNNRLATPIFLHIGWALGQILVAIIGSLFSDWRIIFMLTGGPLIILFYFSYKNILESPRFLVVRHEFAEVRSVLTQIATINKKAELGYTLKEEEKDRENMDVEEKMNGGAAIVAQVRHHSYLSLFRFQSVRVRVVAIMYIWSIISLSYFVSASSELNDAKSIYFNLALAGVIQVIAYLAAVHMSLNVQRITFIKNLLIYSGILHLLFYFVRPIHTYGSFGHFIIMSGDILIRVSMSMGNVFMMIVTIETFPTAVRHFAMGLLGFATKFMYLVANRFVEFWKWRDIHPDFVIGVLLLGGLVFLGKMRETKGHPLKDNLEEDDGTLMVDMKTDIFAN